MSNDLPVVKKTPLERLQQEAPDIWDLLVALKDLGVRPQLTFLKIDPEVIRGDEEHPFGN